ncbi:MAG: hypothetical protein WD097_08545 [Balneolales bacterium]
MISTAFLTLAVPVQAQFNQPPQNAAPQIDVSDDELEMFVNASMLAQEVQVASQQDPDLQQRVQQLIRETQMQQQQQQMQNDN